MKTNISISKQRSSFQVAPGHDPHHEDPPGAPDPLLGVTSPSSTRDHLDDHGQIQSYLTSEPTPPSPSGLSFDSLEEASQEHTEPSPNMPCGQHADQLQSKNRGLTCLGIWYAELLSRQCRCCYLPKCYCGNSSYQRGPSSPRVAIRNHHQLSHCCLYGNSQSFSG